MSLVGTRPPTVDEWDKYELHHRARLATKPGLTGMWQVSGRSNTVFLLRSFPHCWMNDIRNGKSRGQNRRCMMHTWKASVHWMKSLT